MPDLIADVPDFDEQKVQGRKEHKLKNVFDEYKVNDFKPDIFAEIEIKRNGRIYLVPFIIEIAVTHFVDSEKLEKIEKKGISAIEINLSKIERIKNDNELWSELIDHNNIKWLFHSKLEQLIEKKRNYKIQDEKNAENRQLKREEEQKSKIEEFRRQGLLFRKIYNFDIVYCPKERVDNKDKKITLTECESCKFHLEQYFEKIYYDDHYNSKIYVVCGLEVKRERVEDIEL